MSFSSKLLGWYDVNGRELPWRRTRDPYVIWLSEIILQQTRVEQGMPYFLRFVERFPDVKSFAEADLDEVLRLWQGLGYYSRARNMHKTANAVLSEYQGIFPSQYDKLLSLPGIGSYTAAAISSFAAEECRAVLDGNVFRVLARIFGIDIPANSVAGKKYFQELADSLIDSQQPGLYNQAIMDFGALQCKPKQPVCSSCIFSSECVALTRNIVHLLPVKEKKKQSRSRYFHYFLIEDEDKIMVAKRSTGDIWAELHEFPMIEADSPLTEESLIQHEEYIRHFGHQVPVRIGEPVKHVLSHQNIYARFYRLPLGAVVYQKKSNWFAVFSENLDKLAKHKLIFSFLEKNGVPD